RAHAFGTLGRATRHEHGLAEVRSLFLHASGVRDDEIAAHHQMNERDVVDRLDEVNAIAAAEDAADRLLDIGIEMDGIDDLDVVVERQLRERFADVANRTAETLA